MPVWDTDTFFFSSSFGSESGKSSFTRSIFYGRLRRRFSVLSPAKLHSGLLHRNMELEEKVILFVVY